MAEQTSFWAKIPTARVVAVLSVVTSLATVGVTELGKAWIARGESRHQRDVTAASSFRDVARTMEALVADYVSQVIDQRTSSDAARALQANLLRQHQLMQELVSRVPELRPRAGEYESALIDLQNSIPDSTTVVAMRPFWEKTSRVLVLRNQIFQEIERLS